jgi:hypothetical protein
MTDKFVWTEADGPLTRTTTSDLLVDRDRLAARVTQLEHAGKYVVDMHPEDEGSVDHKSIRRLRAALDADGTPKEPSGRCSKGGAHTYAKQPNSFGDDGTECLKCGTTKEET